VGVLYLFDEKNRDDAQELQKQLRDNEQDNRLQSLILNNQKYLQSQTANTTVQNEKIIENTDKNFKAVINASKKGELDRARAGNSTLALFLPLILDTDEDIEQIKRALNITRDQPADRIKIDFNGTHVTIDNANVTSTFRIPIYERTSHYFGEKQYNLVLTRQQPSGQLTLNQ
jgi:hypothetical protein